MGRTVTDSRNLSWLRAAVNSRISAIRYLIPRKSHVLFPSRASSGTIQVEAADLPGFVLKQSRERLCVEAEWFSSPDRPYASSRP